MKPSTVVSPSDLGLRAVARDKRTKLTKLFCFAGFLGLLAVAFLAKLPALLLLSGLVGSPLLVSTNSKRALNAGATILGLPREEMLDALCAVAANVSSRQQKQVLRRLLFDSLAYLKQSTELRSLQWVVSTAIVEFLTAPASRRKDAAWLRDVIRRLDDPCVVATLNHLFLQNYQQPPGDFLWGTILLVEKLPENAREVFLQLLSDDDELDPYMAVEAAILVS